MENIVKELDAEKKEVKEKKVVFTEKIDDAINGYSIGLTFIFIFLFFFFNNDYLHSRLATQIVGTIVGLLGLLMCALQLSKSSSIKGFDNFGMGLVFFLLWMILYLKFDFIILNLLGIIALTAGLYGIIRGSIEIMYSFITNTIVPKEEKPKSTRAKDTFLFISQVFGLILTILNILKMFGLVGV